MTKTFRGLAIFMLVGICGCRFSLPQPKEAMQYFVIEAKPAKLDLSTHGKFPLRVLIRDTTTSPFINGRKIIFSQNEATRGYYQFASWVEPPPKAFMEIALKRLSESGLFQAVVRVASAAVADIQLSSDLEEFYHDISFSPGKVHVAVTGEMVDLRSREFISRKTFRKELDAPSYDVKGAAAAFNEASNEVADEMLAWVADELKKRPANSPPGSRS